MTAPVRLTASAPLPLLVSALGRAGWGPLAGHGWQGVHHMLRTLADMLPDKAGEGVTTMAQIADQIGYTPRHVQDLIGWMEDLGLISYRRGQVWEGRPMPGFIRVNKKRLVDLVRAARPAHDQATKDRNHRTRMRIAGRTLKNFKARRRAQSLPELSSDLPSLTGKKTARYRGASHSNQPTTSERTSTVNPVDYEPFLPTSCSHPSRDPYRCNACKSSAIQAAQAAKAKASDRDAELIRAYAADRYAGQRFDDIKRFAIADFKAGDVHRWQKAQALA